LIVSAVSLILESKKLPLAENLWLKGLATDLNAEAAGTILKESRRRGKQFVALQRKIV
jgi:hypothetical protein